jgi:hypothetical protein
MKYTATTGANKGQTKYIDILKKYQNRGIRILKGRSVIHFYKKRILVI